MILQEKIEERNFCKKWVKRDLICNFLEKKNSEKTQTIFKSSSENVTMNDNLNNLSNENYEKIIEETNRNIAPQQTIIKEQDSSPIDYKKYYNEQKDIDKILQILPLLRFTIFCLLGILHFYQSKIFFHS